MFRQSGGVMPAAGRIVDDVVSIGGAGVFAGKVFQIIGRFVVFWLLAGFRMLSGQCRQF